MILTTLAASLTVAVVSLVPASPAAADNGQRCNENVQSKTFALPGKPDVVHHVMLCFRSFDDGKADARSLNYWDFEDLVPPVAGVRFDAYSIEVTIERRDTETSADQVMSRWTCDLKAYVNGPRPANLPNEVCWTPWISYSWQGHWSADAKITYDINNDGKGSATWNITGTPLW
ncbi:hypothetical protein [Micromonospora sp. DT233]|uniref:hypothetical protein n=1 Tax=Micromonospora sp. DT233 TaxID=3393432 RepID=UPI003CF27654